LSLKMGGNLHPISISDLGDRSHCLHVVAVSGRAGAGKLHPSWEASRQRKEREKNVFVFQGTRKTFVDDD